MVAERPAARAHAATKAGKPRAKNISAGGSPPDAGAPEAASTRERILRSATRFFAEQGFSSTSMPAIAKASGVTAGAIYKHFKSKADLLFEVTRRALESIPFFIQASQREHDAATLPSLAALYTQPELKLLRQLSIELHSAATKDAKVKRAISVSNELTIKWVTGLIAAAQTAGTIDPKLNPVLAASAFSVFIMGLTHMETLIPHLVGDSEWRDFVSDRIAPLVGMR